MINDAVRAIASEFLVDHEGLRKDPERPQLDSVAYKCTGGALTIGYGHNLDARGLSESAARFILNEDIFDTERELYLRLPVFSRLNIARQAVLIDMSFNLGYQGLIWFKNMLVALRAEDYELAASEMLDSRWARQVGHRAVFLSEVTMAGTAGDDTALSNRQEKDRHEVAGENNDSNEMENDNGT